MVATPFQCEIPRPTGEVDQGKRAEPATAHGSQAYRFLVDPHGIADRSGPFWGERRQPGGRFAGISLTPLKGVDLFGIQVIILSNDP